ncbi:MAG: DEAD/DEAH box helicase [Myxococcota bacterium]
MNSKNASSFDALGLPSSLVQTLKQVGYERPSPIQAQAIPFLLGEGDLVAQAQTGTGKTAAFALPLLSQIDLNLTSPQVLVLTPTRELALQVTQAFEKYARAMSGFFALPVYGGQDYSSQLRGLKRGAHVVVGTPGRTMDHLRRGTLDVSRLKTVVLDEADEMLTMGFIEDVQWILEQTPPTRRVALFSATMPPGVRRIAKKHLKSPAEVTIRADEGGKREIRQRFCVVHGRQKIDALSRVLEFEERDATIVFVRTRNDTVRVADALAERGHSVAALSGDVRQAMRERIVGAVKDRRIDVLVATDVAARGLDVERVSHVINFDLAHDAEAHVHRIGRTGRAGRKGDAILFVTPRERRHVSSLERATRERLEPMRLPSDGELRQKRLEKLDTMISQARGMALASDVRQTIKAYANEHGVSHLEIATALATMLGGAELQSETREEHPPASRERRADRRETAPSDSKRRPRKQERRLPLRSKKTKGEGPRAKRRAKSMRSRS